MAPEMVPLNRSLDVDARLWRQDIRGSRAWAAALAGAGVLTADEATRLDAGLVRVHERLAAGGFDAAPDEDIHSLVERLLFEEVGPSAGKLHTGRSRNDQVATDLRLWGREATEELEDALSRLLQALFDMARGSVDLIMPGYTHLQQGQPVRAAHWALSHFWPLARDRGRLRAARASAAVLPLGAGAIAGCPFPVDREALRESLGFDSVSPNSIDAVSDRDWAAEVIFSCGLLGVHLSRLAEDLVVFSSIEFGFVRLGDGYSTGSSLMPQKRNPDVAELVRGKSARLLGNLQAFLTLLKGLPTGYNRDLQEDKGILFDSVDTLLVTVPAMAGAIETAEWREDRIRGAMDTQLLATDLADYLVRRGVPFRTSHEVIGALVRASEERRSPLAELPLEVFQAAHNSFEADVREVFDWDRSVDARQVPGGTARSAVVEQLELAESVLEG